MKSYETKHVDDSDEEQDRYSRGLSDEYRRVQVQEWPNSPPINTQFSGSEDVRLPVHLVDNDNSPSQEGQSYEQGASYESGPQYANYPPPAGVQQAEYTPPAFTSPQPVSQLPAQRLPQSTPQAQSPVQQFRQTSAQHIPQPVPAQPASTIPVYQQPSRAPIPIQFKPVSPPPPVPEGSRRYAYSKWVWPLLVFLLGDAVCHGLSEKGWQAAIPLGMFVVTLLCTRRPMLMAVCSVLAVVCFVLSQLHHMTILEHMMKRSRSDALIEWPSNWSGDRLRQLLISGDVSRQSWANFLGFAFFAPFGLIIALINVVRAVLNDWIEERSGRRYHFY